LSSLARSASDVFEHHAEAPARQRKYPRDEWIAIDVRDVDLGRLTGARHLNVERRESVDRADVLAPPSQKTAQRQPRTEPFRRCVRGDQAEIACGAQLVIRVLPHQHSDRHIIKQIGLRSVEEQETILVRDPDQSRAVAVERDFILHPGKCCNDTVCQFLGGGARDRLSGSDGRKPFGGGLVPPHDRTVDGQANRRLANARKDAIDGRTDTGFSL